MAIGLQVWSKTAASNSNADTNINWAEGMAPSQVNDSARAGMASAALWRDDNNGSIVTAGSSTAYTATSNQIEGSLTSGYTLAVQFHATNDSSATLNVDALGGKPMQVVAGLNLKGGEFRTGSIARFTYSTTGSGQWLTQGADQTTPGITDGSNAFTGNIGEYQSSLLTSGSPVTLATSAGTNITSLALTPGDWDVWGEIFYKTNSATFLNGIAAISNASADTTLAGASGGTDGFDYVFVGQVNNTSGAGTPLSGGQVRTRVSSASSGTYYLNAATNFSGTSLSAWGGLRARRMR